MVASDHPRFDAFDPPRRDTKRPRLGTLHEIRAHWLVDTLDDEWRFFGDIEHAADVPVGVVRHAQPADWRRLFHAASNIDRHAHRGLVRIEAATHQYLARVDADADGEV